MFDRTGRLSASCVAIAGTVLLGGCVTAPADGKVVGLVVIVIERPQPAGQSRPVSLTTTSLGLSVRAGDPASAGMALGYNRDTKVTVPNGGCIDLQKPGVCAEANVTPTPTEGHAP